MLPATRLPILVPAALTQAPEKPAEQSTPAPFKPSVDVEWLAGVIAKHLETSISASALTVSPLAGGFLGATFRVKAQLDGSSRSFILKFGPWHPLLAVTKVHDLQFS